MPLQEKVESDFGLPGNHAVSDNAVMSQTRPELLVVGPGAMGCLFSALLAEKGVHVTMLDKIPERAALISRKGILLRDRHGERHIPVRCEADTSRLPKPDILCVSVKAFDTESAIRHALPAIGLNTIILLLQNGLGNADTAARIACGRPILCTATSQASTLEEPGVIYHAGSGPTIVAPYYGATIEHAAFFSDILNHAGIEAEKAADALSVLWTKLAINASINAVTATANVTNGAILADTTLRQTAVLAAREVAAVASAMNINLLCEDIVAAMENVCRKTSANISSMLQDIRKGRRTEVEQINGAVVREGRRLGVPTPVNEELLKRVLEITAAH